MVRSPCLLDHLYRSQILSQNRSPTLNTSYCGTGRLGLPWLTPGPGLPLTLAYPDPGLPLTLPLPTLAYPGLPWPTQPPTQQPWPGRAKSWKHTQLSTKTKGWRTENWKRVQLSTKNQGLEVPKAHTTVDKHQGLEERKAENMCSCRQKPMAG